MLELLPFLVILLCPLMMLFMMKSHHSGEHKDKKGGEKDA